jgi:hypothetical protein
VSRTAAFASQPHTFDQPSDDRWLTLAPEPLPEMTPEQAHRLRNSPRPAPFQIPSGAPAAIIS